MKITDCDAEFTLQSAVVQATHTPGSKTIWYYGRLHIIAPYDTAVEDSRGRPLQEHDRIMRVVWVEPTLEEPDNVTGWEIGLGLMEVHRELWAYILDRVPDVIGASSVSKFYGFPVKG